MADSKDNEKETASDDFADDLDAMLNEVELSSEAKDELIDDEDAIDRLLMDDAFSSPDGETENDDQVVSDKSDQPSNIEPAEAEHDEFGEDEFGEDEPAGSSDEESNSKTEVTAEQAEDEDEFDVDDLFDSVEGSSNSEEDEFAEIDGQPEDNSDSVLPDQNDKTAEEELVDGMDEFTEDNTEPEPEPEPDSASDDDFLMADFDISADDEEDDIADQVFEPESESIDKPTIAPAPDRQENNDAVLAEITAQISQLSTDNQILKQQIVELTSSSSKDNSVAEEIGTLEKEQRKLRKTIKENEDKVPILVYIALGIAILALLIGGGLGAIGYGAQSDVTALSEMVTTLEEEVEILTTTDASGNIKKINDKINLLTAKNDHTNKQLSQVSESIQFNPLKPVVDDLVIQNNHAQEAIETLLAKVEKLEKRKFVTARKKAKKPVVKVTWVVNLIAYKQEWYAKRKAIEFGKKAVPAEVLKVKVNGETWFRLTVKGFKSKYEAAAYAVKVKKALNLSSVWVTKG